MPLKRAGVQRRNDLSTYGAVSWASAVVERAAARSLGARARSMTDRDEVMAKAVGRAMAKSAALLRVAADAGDSEARFALGLLTLTGRGVERHPGEAYSLLNLAARDGDAQAAALRDMAAEQLAQSEADRCLLTDAAGHVMKNAIRQQRFPKPRLVEPD